MDCNKSFSYHNQCQSQRGAIISEFLVILPIISLIFFIALEVNDRINHQIQHTIATRNAYFNEPKKIATLLQDQANLGVKEEEKKAVATVQTTDALGHVRDWFDFKTAHLNTKFLVDGYNKEQVRDLRQGLVKLEMDRILPNLVKNGAETKKDEIYAGIAKASQGIALANIEISRLKDIPYLELIDEKPNLLQSYYDSSGLVQTEHVKKIEDFGRQISPNKPSWAKALSEQHYYRLMGYKDSGYSDETYKSHIFIGYGFYLLPPADRDNWAKEFRGSKMPTKFGTNYPGRFIADCLMYYYATGECRPLNYMALANQAIFNVAAAMKILETILAGGAFSEAIDQAVNQGLQAIEDQLKLMIQDEAQKAILQFNQVIDEKIEDIIRRQNDMPYADRLKGLPDFQEAYQ